MKENRIENAVLIGAVKQDETMEMIQEHLDELAFLSETAGAKVKKIFVQKIKHIDSRTYIGSGKVEEIAEYVEDNDIDLVIFDNDLTAKQNNLLEERFKRKIIDRSSLILDIFAERAQTAQAKVQVELAQMQYLLPRLRGLWTHLERQRGGIGMRGPGEQEIETDRRIVRDKISVLKGRLDKIEKQQQTQRKSRGKLIRASLVGYTNVGKSTLMRLLTKSEVLVENKLFATLDTTVRKTSIDGVPFLLSDTVGFIRKLPHHLIESFKTTLNEVVESDLLIHVVDISSESYEDHINTVNKTLQSLDAHEKPTILVLNKIDRYKEKYFDDYLPKDEQDTILKRLEDNLRETYHVETIFISATEKINIENLKQMIVRHVKKLSNERYNYPLY